jgi:hypothetical protein
MLRESIIGYTGENSSYLIAGLGIAAAREVRDFKTECYKLVNMKAGVGVYGRDVHVRHDWSCSASVHQNMINAGKIYKARERHCDERSFADPSTRKVCIYTRKERRINEYTKPSKAHGYQF